VCLFAATAAGADDVLDHIAKLCLAAAGLAGIGSSCCTAAVCVAVLLLLMMLHTTSLSVLPAHGLQDMYMGAVQVLMLYTPPS
jgi:hypothetical protein